MATQIKSKPGLLNAYRNCSQEVKDYFLHIPQLLNQYPMDVCLAYVFARLELGQNMALYCGVVRIHKVDSNLARNAVGTFHMKRKLFVELYKSVFDVALPSTAHADLKSAEKTRDAVMHGKPMTDDAMRNAIARALEFAEAINRQLDRKYALRPYGSLKGFAGKARKLDARTSRFVLKGIGFPIA